MRRTEKALLHSSAQCNRKLIFIDILENILFGHINRFRNPTVVQIFIPIIFESVKIIFLLVVAHGCNGQGSKLIIADHHVDQSVEALLDIQRSSR
jgi:hypothetical protein